MTIDENTQPRELFGNAVGSTLVTALYARAFGTRDHDVPEWDDPQARRAWRALSAVAQDSGVDLDGLVLRQRMNIVGTIRRSQALDRRVREFVAAHPGSQVVTLGVGLCNRASRLADLDTEWVGVDYEDVVELRRRLLPDDATRLIAGSVTEPTWLDEIDASRPTVVVAEGLLMYLHPARVVQLLVRLGDRLQGPARVTADMHHSLFTVPRADITALTGATYGFCGVRAPSPTRRPGGAWSPPTTRWRRPRRPRLVSLACSPWSVEAWRSGSSRSTASARHSGGQTAALPRWWAGSDLDECASRPRRCDRMAP